MTTTTVEYWSVIPLDGVEYPLSTLAKNIETWGGDRQTAVPLRGTDQKISWIPGEQETERVADARTMSMGMWVRGCDDNGAIPSNSTRRLEFERNWMTLKRILHNQGKILTLRKRFYDESRVFRIADARARFADGLNPGMLGQTAARFTVDFRLADPYFYSTALTVALASGSAATPTIIGDAPCRKVSFSGVAGAAGASNFSLDDLESLHTVGISSVMGNNASIAIDFALQTARFAGISVAGTATHVGSNDWFRLVPGVNHLTPSATGGAWSGTLTYSPTWN